VAVTEQAREAFSMVAQSNPHLYSSGLIAPQLTRAIPQTLVGIIE